MLPQRHTPLQACCCRGTGADRTPHSGYVWFKVKPRGGQSGLCATGLETIPPLPSVYLNFGCAWPSLPAHTAPAATHGPADMDAGQGCVTCCCFCGDIFESGAVHLGFGACPEAVSSRGGKQWGDEMLQGSAHLQSIAGM